MITKEFIYWGAYELREKHPQLRRGQSIFNYVDMNPRIFGEAARIAQFIYGVDCFYDDKQISAFVNTVLDIVNNQFID